MKEKEKVKKREKIGREGASGEIGEGEKEREATKTGISP